MGLDFANPAILVGGLLFTVPLVIHLLNRRRYQIKSWAAMNFLLLAYKKKRRRLRLENFLLLLLRCLIIVLLAAAMAKPFVPSDSLLSALSTKRRNVVAVVDRSYSMGYRTGPEETCFDAALAGVKNMVRGLDAGRGDTISLIMMGEEIDFAVPLNSIPEDALVKLENPKVYPLLAGPSQGGAGFPALAALLAGEVTEEAEGDMEVFVFTDMQARLFGGGLPGGRAGTAALLQKAAERGAKVRFVDAASGPGAGLGARPNLAVTDIAPLDANITMGASAAFSATIANYGENDLRGVSGVFVLDGKTSERRTVDVRARGRATVELTLRFREPGFHTLSFRLEGDNLPVDDERFLAFEVRESIDVLLVDGGFDFDPFERPTGLIGMMLDPTGFEGSLAGPGEKEGAGEAEGTVFRPVTVDAKSFNAGRENPGRFDAVIFADVEGLTASAAETLHDYLMTGGSAVFFMGARVDLDACNMRLHDAGRRILPARLERFVGEEEGRGSTSFFRMTAPSYDHPVLRVFDDPKLKVLLEVPVFRFVEVEPDDAEGGADGGQGEEGVEEARVVAWFADALGNTYPAIVERALGRGRVMLFTTSADASWSLIAESPKTYLPLLHETLYYLTRPDADLHNLTVGEAIARSVAEFPDRIALTGPDGAERLIAEPVERREFGRHILPLANHPLERAGTYTLEVDSSLSGERLRETYTANVDPLEGDLQRIDGAELARMFPGVEMARAEDALASGDDDDAAAGGELWKTALWILLALVGLELVLSWKFGDYK